ncbi:phosphate signaling complex protein PhoU [Adhaeribacter sp. BT258]|uniref:Phosphate-specific transport system accessory protein PhoU n=1 Tax=Adhaeribacter terrigena TaxID=2793070 RepID=A0ABS1C4C5_9BACT|nr:phosphate signaling complex protein PhoU [Adhaeribacter terrigena]MBK0403370.1 phosphate signaling complex protein PhoU [Adhaeribacter terrigena]
MSHLDNELGRIRTKVNEMWDLVEFQVRSGQEALVKGDKTLAEKIIKRGKKVNEYDLKIDQLCENLLALFNPLAVDLRLILAILKINSNLERIGDTAEGIAGLILEANAPLEKDLMEMSRVLEMYDGALLMLSEVKRAFVEEDTQLAKLVMRQDKTLNKIHRNTDRVIIDYLKLHADNIDQSLKVGGIIRKLERIGDHVTNIAEEIVFYVDAKVVKHKPKPWKEKKRKADFQDDPNNKGEETDQENAL